jgi:hypothetical protein
LASKKVVDLPFVAEDLSFEANIYLLRRGFTFGGGEFTF